MIKATDRNGNSVTLGMMFGGAVQHVITGADKSPCGRYVVVAGESEAPVCRTCIRVLGLTVVTVGAARIPGDCTRDHRHQTLADWSDKVFTPAMLTMLRDVVDDYNNGADNDPCWIAVCAAILANGGKKITADIKTPELTKRQGGNPNAGLIDPNSTSVAKTRKRGCGASEKQEKLIRDLLSQIREIDPEAADLLETVHTDAWINDSKWADISKGIDALFTAKRVIERTARENKTKEFTDAKPVAEKLIDGVYVLDGKYIKLKHNQAGTRQYGVVFNPQSEGWDYTPGIVAKLTPAHRLTEDQAKAFGDLYGSCCHCHRLLTDEESIRRGIGPICAEKYGW